jgi:hypothetical protein
MRIPIQPRLGMGQTSSVAPFGSSCGSLDAMLGMCVNQCGILDTFFGTCSPTLQTASGAAPANITPPAPVAGTSAMINYNPDIQGGQIQGGATELQIANQAAAAQASGSGGGTPAATPDATPPSTCSGLSLPLGGCISMTDIVLGAIIGTLVLVVAVK